MVFSQGSVWGIFGVCLGRWANLGQGSVWGMFGADWGQIRVSLVLRSVWSLGQFGVGLGYLWAETMQFIGFFRVVI